MQPDHDPESKSGSDLSSEAESTHTTSPVNSAPDTGRLKWLWAWVIPAALLAGGLAWIGGESTLTYFVLTEEEMKSGISGITPTDNAPYLRAKRRVAIRNSVLHYGILGVTLGMGLGLVGGATRRTLGSTLRSGLIGAVACGASAVLASFVLIPAYLSYYSHDQPNLFLPLLVHGGIWSAIGLSGGMAMALGMGGGRRCMSRSAAGGLAGAVLATIAYELIYAIAFPLARSELPIPGEPAIRLLAHMMVCLSIAVGATWCALATMRNLQARSFSDMDRSGVAG